MLGDLSSPMLQSAADAGSKQVQRCRLAAALVCAAVVVVHITLLWMLQSEQNGYESSSMVYCEVEGDDIFTGSSGLDVNSSPLPPCKDPSFGNTCCPGACNTPGEQNGGVYDWNCGPLQGSFEWKVSYALGSGCKLWGSQLVNSGALLTSRYRQPFLCPSDMQKDAKHQGFCNIPPTECTCTATNVCFASPKD